MINILIDSSFFIEFSRTGKGEYLKLLNLASKSKVLLLTSVIVVAEYWAGKSMRKQSHISVAQRLFVDIQLYDVNEVIAKRAGEIRRDYDLDLPDALIAATALENNVQLATLNINHFDNIPGLKIWQSPKA